MSFQITSLSPLGYLSFGVTLCIFSLINTDVLSTNALGVVLALSLSFGGPCQILSGLWEYRKGNSYGATIFLIFGSFWLSYFIISRYEPSAGMGSYYFFLGLLSSLLWFGSFYVNKALFWILLLMAATFYSLAFHQFGILNSSELGGWIGEVTGLLALYTGTVEIINNIAGIIILPLGEPIKKSIK